MIKASVKIINPDYVLLLSEEESFEVVLLRNWLPPDIDPGKTVKLHFKLEDRMLRRLLQREWDRRSKTRPEEMPFGEISDAMMKKIYKTLERFPPHFTRVAGMDVLLAFVDCLSSDYGLLLAGDSFFRVVVPRKWLPEQVRAGDSVNVLVQPEGHCIQRMHIPKNLSKQWEKANLPQRKEGLKLVYDQERDNG